MQTCQFGSIRQIHGRLVADGYGLGQATLRQWVKEGRVPALYSGNRALIRYADVLGEIERSLAPQTA